jgi:MYXO-CTERM domain-containing protein
VDLCKGVKCPDGQYCYNGKCKPWPKTGPGSGPGETSPDGGDPGNQGNPNPDNHGGPGSGESWIENGGCACELGSVARPGGLVLLGLLLLGVALRRRER